jgi:hypothetical protein
MDTFYFRVTFTTFGSFWNGRFGALMSFLVLTLVLHLAWISTGQAATADTAHAARASQWALETFVDVTAADGAVLQVELRRHCCHGIAETAARFWYCVIP